MNALQNIKAASLRYFTGILVVLLVGTCIASADPPKKAAAPAKAAAKPAAKPAAAAAKPGAAGARPGAAGAAARPGVAGAAGARPAAGGAAGAKPAGAAAGARPGGATAGAARPGGATAGAAKPAGRTPPNGSKTAHAANGSSVRTRANGTKADVHDAKRGMDVHHGLKGGKRVSVEHADHSRVVAQRGGRGYVQHPYNYHGHEFAHRTYYEHGRAYDRFYRGYSYHGAYVEMYSPAVYYAPGFYGWAYNPWVAPVPYAWGFVGVPWFGFYGGFFTPYPVYASPSLWLTDYMVSQSLAANYQAAQDAQAQGQGQAQDDAPAADAAPLSPQVKDQIAAEVQRQIALENSEAQAANTGADQDPASSGIQRMLTDNIQHVFVAGNDLDVTDAAGNECAITEGDALQLTGPAGANADAATLAVLASKGGKECPRGDTVSIAFADLQDMQNHMRETIDQGLGELQAKGGKGGLPALPPSAAAPPKKAAFAADAPPPDATASTQINQSWGEADKAEQEVAGQIPPDGGGGQAAAAAPPPAAPTVSVDLGQTIDQVTAALGQPKSIVNLGTKKIYVFKDMKVTFKDGKVSDVQ
jgi:hypothetical protein